MYDMRDIREVLMDSANFRFTLMNVKSLLAYQIFLFFIFRIDRRLLISKNEILMEFESSSDLSTQLQKFLQSDKTLGRSSVHSALEYLREAAVLMHYSARPSKEELEILGLKNKPYLFLYLDVKSLKDGCEGEFFDNNYQYKFFDKYIIPQITKLNESIACYKDKVSLKAYQMALFFIFNIKLEHFESTIQLDNENHSKEIAFSEYLLKSYEDFSNYFSTFVDIDDVPTSTILDNLDTLHRIGFIILSRCNPNDEDDFDGYPEKQHLRIVIPLVIPLES
jgi:hypothetical protein